MVAISGFTLRLMRQQAGLTQAQFGKLMRCSGQYVGQVEKGTKRLSYSYVVRALAVFGLDIQDLKFEEVVNQ